MTPQQVEKMNSAIAESIQVNVNGKIDKIHSILERQNEVMDVTARKIDEHIKNHEEDMKELRPWMAGVKGLNILWKFFVMVGLGWYAIKTGLLK